MAAQGSQALAGFALQFLAARYLGLAGLGRFSVLFGLIILATSLSTGFVGDSLTVLDRSRRSIRAGLQWWLLVIAVGTGVLSGLIAVLVGFSTITEAVVFAIATITFVVEDTVRRLLMASMDFWRIVVIDLVALVVGVAVVLGGAAVGDVTLTTVLLALAAGQVAAVLVGWYLLPQLERVVVAMQRPGAAGSRFVRDVARVATRSCAPDRWPWCGSSASSWSLNKPSASSPRRGSTWLLRCSPSVAPVPISSPHTPVPRRCPWTSCCRSPTDAVVKLTTIVVAFCLAAMALMPLLGPVLTGDEYELSAFMVAGWAVYAASLAGVMPYAQMASVRGREAAVFGWRAADSVASLIATYVIVDITNSVEWVPLILAAFPILSGIAIRQLVIERDLAGRRDLPREATAR